MTLKPGLGNRRLLLVDDNPAIHEDYRKILAGNDASAELDALEAAVFGESPTQVVHEFELVEALQGEQALQCVVDSLARDLPFAAAFVDMRMPPGWDGLQTIEHLWEVDPRLQVIICTAYSDYSWDEIIERVGIGDRLLVLKKPFDPIEVRQLAITLTTKWDLERAAEAERDSVVNSAADSILSVCEDGTIESCNPATLTLFEASEEDIVGRPVTNLIGCEDRESVRRRLTETGVGVVPSHEVVGLRGGSEFPLLMSLSVYMTARGRRCTAILRDLSDYKSLQERLARSQRLESIGQLAAGVAHEINTPLQYSTDNLQYIREAIDRMSMVLKKLEASLDTASEARPWQERFEEFVALQQEFRLARYLRDLPDAISESIDGLECVANIVRAMRELTHPGNDTRETSVVDLNQIVEDGVRLSRNRWKESATIEYDLGDGDMTLDCAPQEILRVVINLLTNAADALAEGAADREPGAGVIKVRTSKAEGQLRLSVSDNGPGVAPEVAARIFDPFFTTKQVGKGTGQGLAISHEIVATGHDGHIECSSVPGKGATFVVTLPEAPAPKQRSLLDPPELAVVGGE